MPKSKRAKVIHLTQTQKKTSETKIALVENIRECADNFSHVYVVRVYNERNEKLKSLREEWKPSRFFMGKNKVMGVALGRTEEDEYKENMHLITKHLHGDVGLLFTDKERNEVVEFFNEFKEDEFARGGFKATYDVTLEKGAKEQFPHSMEPNLRKLGLPTELKRGVIHLLDDFSVCKEGQVLSPERADILKHFGIQMAQFRLEVVGCYSNGAWVSEEAAEA